MRLEQLIYLIDVAKTNSITIAAERNYVTQQNISEAIAKLENELEVTLLYRSHKGCSLTEAGVEAVKGAKIIIDNVENLKSTLKPYSNNNSKVRGDLSINSIPAVMRKKFLAEILLEFGNKYPDVVLSVNENNNIDIIRNVISEKIDIGLIAMVNGLLESNNITETEFNNNIYFETLYYIRSFSYAEKSGDIQSHFILLLTLFEDELANLTIKSNELLDFINQSYTSSELSIAMMAEKFHVSIAYMSYLCKKYFNENFSEYLWNLRMAKAKELLRSTSKPIEEICLDVGYENVSSFRRKFKKELGVTPSQYRNGAVPEKEKGRT